jgi:hypothetical protein
MFAAAMSTPSPLNLLFVAWEEHGRATIGRKINISDSGIQTKGSIGLIGEPDLDSTWRAQDGGDHLTRERLIRGSHAHDSDEFHLKCIVLHGSLVVAG